MRKIKGLEDGVILTFRSPKPMVERLDKWAEAKGIGRSRALRNLLRLALDRVEKTASQTRITTGAPY